MTAAGRQHGQKKEGKREAGGTESSFTFPSRWMDGHLYLVLRATVVIFKLALVPFRRANERRYRPF